MFVQVIPNHFVRIFVLSGTFEIDDSKGVSRVHTRENVVIVPTGKVVRNTHADENYDFWYTGKIAFDHGCLDEVLRELEDNYHVIIRVERLPRSEYKFTGVFQKIESVDLILETICSDLGLEYYEEGDGVYVLTRPS
jgi:ferric-dicitrate binding protein FerR (iron transport regulator)